MRDEPSRSAGGRAPEVSLARAYQIADDLAARAGWPGEDRNRPHIRWDDDTVPARKRALTDVDARLVRVHRVVRSGGEDVLLGTVAYEFGHVVAGTTVAFSRPRAVAYTMAAVVSVTIVVLASASYGFVVGFGTHCLLALLWEV